MRRHWGLVLLVVLPRLALFPFNENLGGDAIARTLMAARWLEAPRLMTSFADGCAQFGPLHVYLLGVAHWLWPEPLHAGRLVSLVAGAMTALPLFRLTRQLFDERAATLAVVLFSLWGLALQTSTTACSEAVSLLLVALAVERFSAGAWVASAVCLNLGCATRYDVWLLAAMLAATDVVQQRRAAFALATACFPALWCFGNWWALGDPLFPIRDIDAFHHRWWASEAEHWGVGWYRLGGALSWPLAALLMLGPLVTWGGVSALLRVDARWRWLAALVVLPAVLYGVRSALGSFAPLARFTIKEIFLLLPFAAAWLRDRAPVMRLGALASLGAWTLALAAMGWAPSSRPAIALRPISPVSRLEPQLRAITLRTAAQATRSGLLVVEPDPVGYDDFVIGFHSGWPAAQVHLLRDAPLPAQPIAGVVSFASASHQGFVAEPVGAVVLHWSESLTPP